MVVVEFMMIDQLFAVPMITTFASLMRRQRTVSSSIFRITPRYSLTAKNDLKSGQPEIQHQPELFRSNLDCNYYRLGRISTFDYSGTVEK